MNNSVFISYKNTKDGKQTPDSQMALELYEALTSAGINTFFAGKTLLEAGTDRYKEHIDKELDDCKILIVVGTSVENITSRWVKYEWDGFVLDILNGCRKKIFTYIDGFSSHDLPRALRGTQAFTKSKVPLATVVKFIKNALDSIDTDTDADTDSNFDCETTDSIVKSANPVDSEEDIMNAAFELSSLFLHSGATPLKDCDLTTVEAELECISRIFKDIHTVKHIDEIIESQDIANTVYSIIHKELVSSNGKLLKIKGPLGSYKNRLLQYLYLYMAKKDSDTIPFYIDVAMYERFMAAKNSCNRDELEDMVKSHFKQIRSFTGKLSNRKSVVIIDGVRDFSSGRDRIYSVIRSELSSIDCRLIVSMDTDFTNNPKNKFVLHPLAGTDYEYFIRINSMSIYNKEKSIQFIRNCIDSLKISIPYDGVDEFAIYDRLVNLGIITLDAYWLKNLLTEMLGSILNSEVSISDLYEAICLRAVDQSKLIDSAKLAFEYEYGEMDFSDSELYSDTRWKILRRHRTVLEYLIARYYVYNFENLDYKNIDTLGEKLDFFCMVLPKSVSLFISPMISKFDDYENKVFRIVKRYYSDVNTFERNEMVYWLGRMKSTVRKEEARLFLKEKWGDQRNTYLTTVEKNTNQLKNIAFLLRTISVSLIIQGDREVAHAYFDLLLNDKLTNEINRGFHLVYYGDKKYIPNKTQLDFMDDKSHGINTLDSLCVSIEAKKQHHKFDYLLILELFTVCSLLQARIEASTTQKNVISKFKPYAIKTIEYLNWILRQRRLNEFENMRFYFEWVLGELDKYYINGEEYSQAVSARILSKALSVERTGWINRNVLNPENIVEHMYSCWLIGVLYLPDSSNDEGYDKNTILNMLLIHDIGETETGDIPRPEKEKNRQKYDEEENKALQSLFLARTYPRSVNMTKYQECWNNWYDGDCRNALIAKDIDIIQAVFQYCTYCINGQIKIDQDDIQQWFDELYDVVTPEGHQIVNILILQNPAFKELVSEYALSFEEYYG